MCGIAGIAWDDQRLVRRMAKCVRHRGPDQAGVFTDGVVSLAHQRLAIIDISLRGKQPMTNEDGTIWVVFNGEIYNWKELRQRLEQAGHRFTSDADTEVIVHGYEQYGEQCFALLEGDFAIALYDSNKRQLFLARDRVGIKPLYYTFLDGSLVFASEIKAVLECPGLARQVNRRVLDRYLTLRYPFGKETMFQSIFRVLPGELIRYDCASQQVEVKKFASVAKAPLFPSEQTMVAQLRAALTKAVQRQMMSDVPLGAYLSGGVDSASVVALMQQQCKEPLKTFSVGFGLEDTDELRFARSLSDQIGTDHHEIILEKDVVQLLPKIIWHSDEPIADPAMIPVYVLSREAKKDVTVVLTGDGGDELFAGYEQQKFLRLTQRAARIPGLRTMLAAGLSFCPPAVLNGVFKYARDLGTPGILRAQQLLRARTPVEQYLAITAIFSAHERRRMSPHCPLTTEHDLRRYLNNPRTVVHDSLRFEFDVQLPENMLMKTDRMTLAHAVEARVPLLDTHVLAVASRIPLSWKLRGRTEKYIFRKAVAPFVPKLIAQRKKQRFYVPIDHWLRQCRPLLDECFSSERLRHGLLNPQAIQKIRGRYSRAPLFYARQLWSLLTFQLWHKQFIEEYSSAGF